jgi:hypothetical protein
MLLGHLFSIDSSGLLGVNGSSSKPVWWVSASDHEYHTRDDLHLEREQHIFDLANAQAPLPKARSPPAGVDVLTAVPTLVLHYSGRAGNIPSRQAGSLTAIFIAQ